MISRIKIQNFKAFKEAEIKLSNLNLFTGMNGMGKSSFIQSLLLLRQSYADFMPDVKGLVLKGGINGIIDIGTGKDAFNIYAESDHINFQIDMDDERFLDVSFDYDAESDILPLNSSYSNFYNNPGDYPLFSNKFKYLKAERIAPENIYKANYSQVKQEKFLGYKGENTALYIALYKLDEIELENVKHEKAQANNLISNIDAWLSEITPGTKVVSTYYNALDVVKLGYQFIAGKDITPEFTPLNVGFGITYTLPILTAILSAEKDDLLIIENPETHLHPKGQSKLAQLIALAANEGVQIIIETHSDHIINGVLVACKKFEEANKGINRELVKIYHFTREDEIHLSKIDQINILPSGKVDKQPTDFFDQVDRDLKYLLGF